jgi:hypothetical protein
MAAPVSEAQRSVINLTNAMAGSTPRVHLPAWIVEHMTHAPRDSSGSCYRRSRCLRCPR